MVNSVEPSAIREIFRQDCFYAILPRHGVYLHARSPITDEEAKRFARLFHETWKRIPFGPRRAILKHWRNHETYAAVFSPFIELSPGWYGQERPRGGHGLRGTKATVSSRGHMLRFWSKIVAAYPDNLVRDLISHELTHVLQSAWGWDLEPADPFAEEEDADLKMQFWGFDPEAMDEWDREHGITKTREIDPDTPAGKRALKRAFDRILKNGR